MTRNPVPRGLAMRRPGQRAVRGVPLIRAPRTLPRVISAEAIDALMAALRTQRDRAMVEAMLLGGLRRCEVLGVRFEDLHPREKRVFIAEGKGGHQRIVPLSTRFFITVAAYLETERPSGGSQPPGTSSCGPTPPSPSVSTSGRPCRPRSSARGECFIPADPVRPADTRAWPSPQAVEKR